VFTINVVCDGQITRVTASSYIYTTVHITYCLGLNWSM